MKIVDEIFHSFGLQAYKIYILLFLMASFLKIYDNVLDWNINVSNTVKELLKISIVILATITFLTDLNAIYGCFFLHAFYFFTNTHGVDNDYFKVGFYFVTILSILNLFISPISTKTLFEMIIIGCIGYLESIWFQQEFSIEKVIIRIITFVTLCCISFAHLTNEMTIFSDITIKLLWCGIGYLGTDLFMLFLLNQPKKLLI